VIWGEEFTEAKSSLTLVKEVKLSLPTRGLKSPREDLTPGKNQETDADISWVNLF
jgi:hypothetical protein